jgi:hypothetical protein
MTHQTDNNQHPDPFKPYRGRFQRYHVIPKKGRDKDDIFNEIATMAAEEETKWKSGKASGTFLSASHQLQIWDALILSVAAENRSRFLISEDFQNGFTWKGVTIVNLFDHPVNPLFQSILKDKSHNIKPF